MKFPESGRKAYYVMAIHEQRLAARKLGTNAGWLTLTPENVHRALYISDVFVLPSLSEGLPNALIEAVLAGLPVICHPHPGGKYILG
jgi:glycosyltransferase involved in cell wall biosynthesis